jgi:hypothetical protein
MIDAQKLRAPFPPDAVSWRVGSMTKDKAKGMALAFIDARDVMDRLDDVCGPENWQCRYSHANGKTVCDLGIKYDAEFIWKADGAGDSDVEAEKGALSDAFKRAAVRHGIGRYLYSISSPWVEVDEYKRIKEPELVRLRKLLGEAPKPAEPPKSGSIPMHYPDGPDVDHIATVTEWLTLYEKCAETFGHLAMWESNDGTIASIQAKAVKADKQDIVRRVKKLYDATQEERKVA